MIKKFRALFSKTEAEPKPSEPSETAVQGDWFAQLMDARTRKIEVSREIYDACREAALKDDAKAQAELSLMNFGGEGLENDSHEAMYWFKAAATDVFELNMTYNRGREFDMPAAYYGLFVMWWLGIGVPVDEEMSNKNLRLAAEKGCPPAMAEMGARYQLGLYSFDRDAEKAENWFLRAIEHGHLQSYGPLSSIVLRREEYDLAFKYLERAAHHDGYCAIYGDLANLLVTGQGTKIDHVEALKWYYVAGLRTEKYDSIAADLLASMTQGEIAEGIERATTWLTKNKGKVPRLILDFDRPKFLTGDSLN